MYGATAEVRVKEVEPEQRVSLEWGGDGSFRDLEIVFKPWGTEGTYVQTIESGQLERCNLAHPGSFGGSNEIRLGVVDAVRFIDLEGAQ